jgi:hypothetical protein
MSLPEQGEPRIPREVIVFDAKLWREAGYDQPDDNAQFFKAATVLSLDGRPGPDQMATVRFHHDGRVSAGHFVNCFGEDDRLSVHVDVCPECGEVTTYHPLDPPMFCKHARDRYVPVRFVESDEDWEARHA